MIRSRVSGGGLAAFSCVLAVSCTKASSKQNPDEVQFLERITEGFLTPELSALGGMADNLEDAADDYEDSQSVANKNAVLGAFEELYLAWQRIEVLQLGPLASSASFTGGQKLRDEVYSWPDGVLPCAVDKNLVDNNVQGDWDSVSEYGFDAIAYLLGKNLEEEACSVLDIPDDDWAGFGNREARGAKYIASLAGALSSQLAAINTAWADFSANLAEAGASSSEFSSSATAVDEAFRAYYYLEQKVKDLKLNPDPESDDELPWTELSHEAVNANLEAARWILLGGESDADGYGFADLLADKGHTALANDMISALDAAIDDVDELDQPIALLRTSDNARLEQARDAVKTFSDYLKNDVPAALQVSIPSDGGGDTD